VRGASVRVPCRTCEHAAIVQASPRRAQSSPGSMEGSGSASKLAGHPALLQPRGACSRRCGAAVRPGARVQRGDEERGGRPRHAAAARAPGEHDVRGLRARLHDARGRRRQQRQQQAQVHDPAAATVGFSVYTRQGGAGVPMLGGMSAPAAGPRSPACRRRSMRCLSARCWVYMGWLACIGAAAASAAGPGEHHSRAGHAPARRFGSAWRRGAAAAAGPQGR